MTAPYDGAGHNEPPWWPSRYGAGDRLGSGNELTAERTMRALQIPTEGRVIELAQVADAAAPAVAPRAWRQTILAHEAVEEIVRDRSPNRVSFLDEQVTASHHVGCHLDGLAHTGIDGRFYNGVPFRELFEPTGVSQLGIESVRPWVARGVCLDVAAVVGVPRLDAGFVVTPQHLQAAADRQAVDVEPGDAVLVHTGWANLWRTDPDRYQKAEPGVGWAAAHWLTNRRASLVGADNWGFEVLPSERSDRFFWVHQHLLAEAGTHILENVDTAPLVAGGYSRFLFILSVPRTRGSTAAPAAPLAVV